MKLTKRLLIILILVMALLAAEPGWAEDNSLQKAKESYQEVMRLYKQGQYAEAITIAEKSLAIIEKAMGSEHPDTATAIYVLASLYNTMGAYDKAEALFKSALAIQEKTMGPEHPITARFLNNLGMHYYDMGAYEKAEPLLKRSLMIRKKILGTEHPDTATAMHNMAELYRIMGSYDKAEPLLKQTLAIYEKALGPENPRITPILNVLGLLYGDMGDYDKAELFYQRSLAIREKALGPEHPSTATAVNNLALFYYDTRDYDKAFPLFQRSLAIREKVLGPEHPETAQPMINLAAVYDYRGSYDKAESLLRRSLAIREKAFGPEHPETANSLNNMAWRYYKAQNYDKAEPLFRRSLAIREKAFGPEHPKTAESLNSLALICASQGQSGEALSLMERAQGIDKKQIDQILGFTAEAQQTKFLATRENNFFAYLSLIHQSFSDKPQAVRNALDAWLGRKGILLETQKSIQDVLAGASNTKVQEILADLTRVRQELAQLVLGESGKEATQAYQKRIAVLNTQKETLEGQLSRLSQAFAQQRKTKIATTSTVASSLPKDSVLVEMARIKEFDFKTGKFGDSRYLAFILTAGNGAEVSLIDLGAADELEEKVAALKKSLGNNKTPPDLLAKQSNELYKIIFAPLTSTIGKSRQIFLSPDGSLNLIPFEVLQNDKGRYLVETHTFRYVSAGRDIAGYGMVKKNGHNALLMGDPDFDLASGATSQDKERTVALSRNMQGIKFPRLPGTKEEVKAIATLLGRSASDTYTGIAATESVLMQKKSPRILHLATHGFFLSDQDWTSMMDEKSRGIAIIARELPSGKKPVRIENPFLRSGLALAGANSSLAQKGATEGILTAEKILGLDLRGTDMVVLSACETGIGDVKNGEGVYGLRRAFIQAGAKSLVMSMWEVPDQETKELMINFYKNLQSGKMNRAEALRNAALKQRQTVKTRYGNDNPYYWGAFVFLGEAE